MPVFYTKKRGIGMFVAEAPRKTCENSVPRPFITTTWKNGPRGQRSGLDPRTAHRLDKERISRCPLNAKTLQNSLGAHVPWIKSPSRWSLVILRPLGNNGAGKSTLLSILTDRQLPDQGTVTVDGLVEAATVEAGGGPGHCPRAWWGTAGLC